MDSIKEKSHQSISDSVDEVDINCVQVINLTRKTCRGASIKDILNPKLLKPTDDECVLLIIKPSIESIVQIRKAYNLHPILDYDCSYSELYSIDHIFNFNHYLFINLVDLPGSEDLINPAFVKIILMDKIAFIIVSENLPFIEEIFCNAMGFNFLEYEDRDPVRKSTDFVRRMQRANILSQKNLQETRELGELEAILYKMFNFMFTRIEDIIKYMNNEVTTCIDFINNLSSSERYEIIMRMNNTHRNLSLCRNYVNKKAKMLPQLIDTKFFSPEFSKYLISMGLRMEKLEKTIKTSKKLLKSHEHVHNSIMDEGIKQASLKSSQLFKVFSAVTSIFLPLNLIACYMGMNIRVPFQWDLYDTLWPFNMIILFCIVYFVFIVIFFKIKRWL